MPPAQEQKTTISKSGIKWHEVTWYSKLGAIILLCGVVPALAFYIGTQYSLTQKFLDTKVSQSGDSKNLAIPNLYKSFTSEKYGISMSVPKEWIVNEYTQIKFSEGTNLTITSPDFDEQPNTMEGDAIIRKGGKFLMYSRTLLASETKKSLEELGNVYGEGGNAIAVSELMLGGEKAVVQSLTIQTQTENDGKITFISVKHNDQLFSIAFSFSPLLSAHQDILDEFINDFKFGM